MKKKREALFAIAEVHLSEVLNPLTALPTEDQRSDYDCGADSRCVSVHVIYLKTVKADLGWRPPTL